MDRQEQTALDSKKPADDLLPPWVAVGETFYGHKDWKIQAVVGLWIQVVEAKSSSTSAGPDEAWIYLPTGVIYGGATLQRRSNHGVPTNNR